MQTPEPVTLAIGPYPDWAAMKLREEFGAPVLRTPNDLPGLAPDRRQAVRAVAYLGGQRFGAEQMDLLPNLGLIANFGVGYEAIDIDAARARGIRVTNTPDVLNDDVADLAVALALAQFRQVPRGDEWVRSGTWEQGPMPLARKMSGRPAGILGLGRVGFEIAHRLSAFRMPIHYWSRSEKETPGWTRQPDPVALAQAVDLLVVVVVGGAETENIVDANVLSALGPDGVLVNVSRGTTVDEDALVAALTGGTIAGAALDVFRGEPSPDPRLVALENVVLHPHGGSATHETRGEMAKLQRVNIRAFLDGAPLPSAVV